MAADLTGISSGSVHSCGLRSDGTVVCWGRDWEGQSSEPKGEFAAVGAYRHYSCGARKHGGIECWGQEPRPIPDRFTGAEEKYIDVALGYGHVCVLLDDGMVDCWADDYGVRNYGLDHIPEGKFTSIDAEYSLTCGVTEDGSVICWGGGTTRVCLS